MSAEPVGVMKCWECIEKHARDMEHHLEDLVRVTKGKGERLRYEQWIDFVREIRKYAHHLAKDIAVEPLFEEQSKSSNPAKPIRVERGKDVWVEVFHEKEECHPATFRVIKPNPTHVLTVCCSEAPVAGRCPVAMMAQKLEHLHPEGQGSCPICQGA